MRQSDSWSVGHSKQIEELTAKLEVLETLNEYKSELLTAAFAKIAQLRKGNEENHSTTYVECPCSMCRSWRLRNKQ